MYKICFFVPTEHVEQVKSAMFAVGAGRMGNYDHCCWQVLGQGQFRGNDQSNPFLGGKEVVEYVQEYKVEMVCGDTYLAAALAALRATHPYEEPAFEYYRINC